MIPKYKIGDHLQSEGYGHTIITGVYTPTHNTTQTIVYRVLNEEDSNEYLVDEAELEKAEKINT